MYVHYSACNVVVVNDQVDVDIAFSNPHDS